MLLAAVAAEEAAEPSAETDEDDKPGRGLGQKEGEREGDERGGHADEAESELLGLEHLLDAVHGEGDVDFDFLDLDKEGADEGS